MPLKKIKFGRESAFIIEDRKLVSYLPYSEKEVKNFGNYNESLDLYGKGKKISFIAKKLNLPWATIRDWVYKRTKPKIFHGKWAEELLKRKVR